MYELRLTDKEVEDLAWLADRGYFPGEIYDNMYLANGFDETELTEKQRNDPNFEKTWLIEEHIAWELIFLREKDPDAYLACLGGNLLEKIIELENQII